MDGVAADAVGGVLHGGGFGEQADGAFGAGVSGAGAGAGVEAHQPGDGGYVDDGAAAGGAHSGYGGAGAQKDALAVDVHNLIPHGGVGFVDAGGVEAADVGTADAGVVHQDVQLAVAGHGGGDGVGPLVGAGYVQVDVGGLAAEFADFGFQFHTFVVQDVADDHGGAFTDEQAGFGGALPAGAAADEGNFTLQSHNGIS